MDKKQILSIARDATRNTLAGNYSISDASTALREELKAANGGSTIIDRRALRANPALYDIVEDLITVITTEGVRGDEFFMNFVDERNLALGDKNEFVVPQNSTFVVAKMADGISTPRRQRIGEATKISVPTYIHALRIYEEFSRFMAGRIDWNELVDKVAAAMLSARYEDIYTTFTGITSSTIGLSETYVKSGTYSEDTLMELIDHVEAANNAPAIVLGTKAALRKATTAVVAEAARTDVYNMGYYGKINGTDAMFINQRHKAGTEEFLFNNKELYVVSGNDKFIKQVLEGDTVIVEHDYTDHPDMTMDYFMSQKWGTALVLAGKIGKYTLS